MNALLAWRPWLVGLIAAVMFLTNLGGSRLWDEDETKNARCGVEMHQRNDWIKPTYNDDLRAHKPVLLYWAMRVSYASLGISEFSARLPSALAAIAIVLMCYHLARLLFDRETGLLAAMLLSSALMFATLARAATPDGVLMISTTAALLAFVAGVSARRGGHFASGPELSSFQLPIPHTIAMYVAMGFAVLAKGPIGVLLPLWAICLYGLFGEPVSPKESSEGPWWRRFVGWFVASAAPSRWLRGAWAIRMPVGLLIVAAVAGPWYLAVSLRTGGDWLTGFLGTHNVGRFASAMEGHSGPPYYYVIAVMAGFFPASCFLPVAVVGASWRRSQLAENARSWSFALAIIAAWMTVFSAAATKLPNYVIPCYIGLATVTAAWLVSQVRRFESAEIQASIRTWLGAGMASSALVGLILLGVLGFVGGVLMGSTPLLGLVGLAPLAGGVVALLLLRQADARRAVIAFAGGGLAFTFCGMTLVGPAASPYADGPAIADRIEAMEASLGRPLSVATYRYTTPSLVWELDRHVPGLLADEAVELLEEKDSLVVMSKEAYEGIADQLPTGVTTLAEQGRFLRRERRVVLVGPTPLVAHVPHESELR